MKVNTQYLIQLSVNSKNIYKRIQKTIELSGGFTVVDQSDPRKVDIMIYELGESTQKDIEHVEMLLKMKKVDEIFLTSDYADTSLLTKAMRVGVNEFFFQPIKDAEMLEALERFKKRNEKSKIQHVEKNGQVITVFGSKGGVGTTTLAVNLAISIKQTDTNKAVVLIDMNTLFGEIPLFLEMSPKFDWGAITKNIDRLDTTFLSNILSVHKSGVQLLPSPAYLNGHIRPTPSTMIQLLGLMKQMFDFIIIDGGQSTDDTSLKVLEVSETILLITILSLPCLANTNKLIKSFSDLGYVDSERIKIILNRHTNKSNISLDEVKAGVGREIYWKIPNDFYSSMNSINNGKPLRDIAPKANITKSIFDLAKSFSNPESAQKRKKMWSIFNRS
jgi:pilus assembly protein CpaE